MESNARKRSQHEFWKETYTVERQLKGLGRFHGAHESLRVETA